MQYAVCTWLKTPTLLKGSIFFEPAVVLPVLQTVPVTLCNLLQQVFNTQPQRCFMKPLDVVCKCQFCTGSCGRANNRQQQHRAFCAAAVVCADRYICDMWLEEEQGVHRRCQMRSCTQCPSLRGEGLSGSC